MFRNEEKQDHSYYYAQCSLHYFLNKCKQILVYNNVRKNYIKQAIQKVNDK